MKEGGTDLSFHPVENLIAVSNMLGELSLFSVDKKVIKYRYVVDKQCWIFKITYINKKHLITYTNRVHFFFILYESAPSFHFEIPFSGEQGCEEVENP